MGDFDIEVADRIEAVKDLHDLQKAGADFMRESTTPKYSYNFSSLGRPIIQYPQDMVGIY